MSVLEQELIRVVIHQLGLIQGPRKVKKTVMRH